MPLAAQLSGSSRLKLSEERQHIVGLIRSRNRFKGRAERLQRRVFELKAEIQCSKDVINLRRIEAENQRLRRSVDVYRSIIETIREIVDDEKAIEVVRRLRAELDAAGGA